MALSRIAMRPLGLHARRIVACSGAMGRSVHSRMSSTAPVTIADGSFWRSLVPKPLRKENRAARKSKRQKDWNPATFFIVMFLFIGSMSIQMIALRNSSERYIRQANARIAKLREIVEKIQNGEDVDVEKVLGTGEPESERDWEEMLAAIERDEMIKKEHKSESPSKKTEKDEGGNEASKNNTSETPSEVSPKKPKTASFGNFF